MAAMARSAASSLLIASSIANLSSSTRPWSSSRVLLPIISSSKIEKKKQQLLLSSSLSLPFSFRARSSMATEAGGETSPSPSAPPPPPPVADTEEKEEEKVDPIMEAAQALDMRVGRVLKAWRHPEADSLYVEEVDVGEAEPRTICSGLVNYIPLEHLQDSKVIVLANLKPRNMRGIRSNGMLMAASDASHEVVELLLAPEGSVPGERIWFGEEEEKDKQPNAASPNQVQKKKIWEFVQPHLKTTDTCVAVLGAYPMRTSAGVVKCTSLENANIS